MILIHLLLLWSQYPVLWCPNSVPAVRQAKDTILNLHKLLGTECPRSRREFESVQHLWSWTFKDLYSDVYLEETNNQNQPQFFNEKHTVGLMESDLVAEPFSFVSFK